MLAGLTQAFDMQGGGAQGREDGDSLGAKGEQAEWPGARGGLGGHQRVWSPGPDSLPGHDIPRGRDSAGTRVPDTRLSRKGRP